MGCSCCKPPGKQCREYTAGDEGLYFCKGKDCESSGTVWGTGPYTFDSCACEAAAHAGVIDQAGGGMFKITKEPGQDSYSGSTANGVTTCSFGKYHASISISKAF